MLIEFEIQQEKKIKEKLLSAIRIYEPNDLKSIHQSNSIVSLSSKCLYFKHKNTLIFISMTKLIQLFEQMSVYSSPFMTHFNK